MPGLKVGFKSSMVYTLSKYGGPLITCNKLYEREAS